MTKKSKISKTTLSSVPKGMEALALKDVFLKRKVPLLFVEKNEKEALRVQSLLSFFAPEIKTFVFPSWDCLPYDRVGPTPSLAAQRLDTLYRLSQEREPFILLTTVNAVLQRVVPSNYVTERTLNISLNEGLSRDRILLFLKENGYRPVGLVAEKGDYAIRGDLIDVYSPTQALPLRLDFFDQELEKIRFFDSLTQRTVGQEEIKETLLLLPYAEFVLNEETIERFRIGYRDVFGPAVLKDPLYEAISAGQAYTGGDHWLPLFHEKLSSIKDYVPEGVWVFGSEVENAMERRLEAIEDFYQARCESLERDPQAYKPLPPERLYFTNFNQEIQDVFTLSPFSIPQSEENEDAVWPFQGRPGDQFTEQRQNPDLNLYEEVGHYCRAQQKETKVMLTVSSEGAKVRLSSLLEEQGGLKVQPISTFAQHKAWPKNELTVAILPLERGFKTKKLTVITETDILGDRLIRKRKKKKKNDNFLTEYSSLQEGDFVVHIDHGIGRYECLKTVTVEGISHDVLEVSYRGGDRLFVPVENIETLSRYGGASEDVGPVLDRLGQGNWQERQARLKKKLKSMAKELIKIAAARETQKMPPVHLDEKVYQDFVLRFPYVETEDQQQAIESTLEDLASGRAMDRLICGDVGFGKTEVAIRAAFASAMAGEQVAIIAPTTLLARQHYLNFKKRFKGLPVRIEMLSRLVSAKVAKETKEALAKGDVDIVIGTHALLSKNITFGRLGLMVIDEEQRFGVRQKESLKQLKGSAHALALTATPIPRTLQLGLAGVKDLSLITTAPVDRLSVHTFVLPWDPVVLREAIMREHFRGGQSFVVCPRLKEIQSMKETLEELVPEVKVCVAHGQLNPTELEEVMTAFYDREYDLLLATNIVESGLDIPTMNTMIIHRADLFGLSQLYQLRGRVGRSKIRGYAYLTLDPKRVITDRAKKRLEVMQTLDSLGAGFQLASHDLDIRGAGNLLGEEQSGHIKEVGIELYQQMLEEAVRSANAKALGGKEIEENWSPQINLGTSVFIPELYVSDLSVRMGLYRRLGQIQTEESCDSFAAELIDRFGPLPKEVENLMDVMSLKSLCKTAHIEKLDVGEKGIVVSFKRNVFPEPERLLKWIDRQKGVIKLRPDHKLVYRKSFSGEGKRSAGARRFIEVLAKIASPVST